MPDNNRFAGLGEAVEEPDEDQEHEREQDDREESVAGADAGVEADAGADEAPESGTGVDADAAGSESAASPGVETDPDDASPVSPQETGPAFEFDDTSAKSIYVREETLQILEDTEFEVEMLLRREHDVRDVTGREFHDAAVRVLESYPEEIVSAILDARDSRSE